jgi:uncharacterized membrane protein YdjX (TVP38/TMEM64 family)
LKSRSLVSIALLLLVIAAAVTLILNGGLRTALVWTTEHREISWLLFVALYIVATVCLLPGLILTIAAGAIFGLPLGVAAVSVGSVLGATAAFFIGRTQAREWVAAKVAGWEKFRALDAAIQSRGFWIVLLTRLSPAFPFNLLNYAYGLTSVRPRDYIIGSWIGMFPATVLYVYAGTAAANLSQALAGNVSTGDSGRVLLWIGLAATVVVAVLVTRLARRELDRALVT